MTREERLAILGADGVAEIRRRVAAAPPPPPELIEELRRIFAPALARLRAERAVMDDQVAA
jgi:hypothetical protein